MANLKIQFFDGFTSETTPSSVIASGPAGIDGSDGDITWHGAWVSQEYTANQAVEHNGTSYTCHTNTTSSQIPTDTNYWDVMADKGSDGAAGTNGSDGEGVVAGGTTGQVLSKIDGTDYNTEWTTPSGGSGAVDSVFSRTGVVVAATNDYTFAQIDKTTSDLADLTTKSHTSLTDIGTKTHATLDSEVTANNAKVTFDSTSSTKVGHISVTQAVNLDTIESDTATNNAKVSYTDATAVGLNTTHRGVVTGNPHTVTKSEVGLGSVVNADTTTTANITDSSNKRFMSDAQETNLDAQSGTNTGDQTSVTGNSGDTNALKSATTTVNVSSATAPTTGQVLTATSGTAATWQTASGGGANTALSNLASVAINSDLIFDIAGSVKTTNETGSTTSADVTVVTGTTANGTSGITSLLTGDPSGTGGSGEIFISSGHTDSGNSGNVYLETGFPFTGTRGDTTVSGNDIYIIPDTAVKIAGLLEITDIFGATLYELPTSDGTAGQVLETDGSGVTTWETPSTIYASAQYTDGTGGTSVNATTNVTIPMATADFEDTGFSNTAGVVTITTAGRYKIESFVSVAGTTANYRYGGEIGIYKNSSTLLKACDGAYIRATSGHNETSLQITHVFTAAASDTIEIKIKRITTVTGNATTTAAKNQLLITRLT